MVRGSLIAASAAVVLMPQLMAAQGKQKEDTSVVIPDGARPPEGMCRVWLRDVPERQQPAPTDCATALRTRPRNSILLFGDLTFEAKQPPGKRVMSPANAASRTFFDDPIIRRSQFFPIDPRVVAGTLTPSQALQAAEAAARAEAAPGGGKAEQTKAAATKRPPPPPQ